MIYSRFSLVQKFFYFYLIKGEPMKGNKMLAFNIFPRAVLHVKKDSQKWMTYIKLRLTLGSDRYCIYEIIDFICALFFTHCYMKDLIPLNDNYMS